MVQKVAYVNENYVLLRPIQSKTSYSSTHLDGGKPTFIV